MSDPLVSILLPAFKPRWIDQAIASAFAQDYQNFELLISDDTSFTEIEAIVSKWESPKLSYFRNPNRHSYEIGANRDYLLSLAKGKYIKFLFDDDFLLPNSLTCLVGALETSDSKLAFHHRYKVNEYGMVNAAPIFLAGTGKRVLPSEIFFSLMTTFAVNLIGEPPNILIDRATLESIPKPFSINGRNGRFYTDIALFTNFIINGHTIIGCSEFGSVFRHHASQASSNDSPFNIARFYERDLIRRWMATLGYLSPEEFNLGNQFQLINYQHHVDKYPILQSFLDYNRIPIKNNEFLNAAYLQVVDRADQEIEVLWRKMRSNS